jgi:hypothetical protein
VRPATPDPLTGPCARCGEFYDEHTDGYCFDGIDTDGVPNDYAATYVPPEIEGDDDER